MTRIGGLLCASAIAASGSAMALHWPFQTDGYLTRADYPIRFTLPAPIAPLRAGPPSASAEDEHALPAPIVLLAAPSAGGEVPAEATEKRVFSHSGDGWSELKFDLADYSEGRRTMSASALEVRKPFLIDRTSVGEAQISILSGSKLAIAGGEIGRLLDAAGRGDARPVKMETSDRLYTFDELRSLGFGIEYDPVADRIQLSTRNLTDRSASGGNIKQS